MFSFALSLARLVVFTSSFSMATGVNVSSVASDAACFLDPDANGVITSNESAMKLSTIVGVAPASITATWNSWECSEFKRHDLKPHFVHHVLSMFFVRTGRFGWDPCRIALAQKFGAYYDFNADIVTSIKRDDFVVLLSYFMVSCETTLQVMNIGSGVDQCLSRAEYDLHATIAKDSYLQKLNRYSRSIAFAEWAGSLSISNFSEFSERHTASCVPVSVYAERTCASFRSAMRNVTAPCNITVQLEDSDTKDDSVPVILFASLCLGALCAVVSCCLGARLWIKSRRQHDMLDESHQVQMLLKAKIDAWALLDSNLQADASSLPLAFKCRLDIAIPDQERSDLFNIVHPDDFESLLAAHNQQKRAAEVIGSPPIVAKLRLQYHATAGTRREYEIQYLPAELVLAANSRGQVCVGLTVLAEVIAEAAHTDDLMLSHHAIFMSKSAHVAEENGSQAQSRASRAENILNGSDVLSCNESAAATFVSMEANDHTGGQVTFRYNQEKMLDLQHAINTRYGRAIGEPSAPAGLTMSM
eukprot:TRINITY_DN4651_c1_g1_i1.p1 TRINITY_DN4651_c1_g1~~TRINITY_DN4651_c1_g1_i1.p1  ORF type:complete len:530 (+),score=58.49 TRINITY_DN4651_c1_g1_i1:149-1738(+)